MEAAGSGVGEIRTGIVNTESESEEGAAGHYHSRADDALVDARVLQRITPPRLVLEPHAIVDAQGLRTLVKKYIRKYVTDTHGYANGYARIREWIRN